MDFKSKLYFTTSVFFSSLTNLSAQHVSWSQPFIEDRKMQYLKITGTDEEGFFLLRSNISFDNERDHSGFRSRKYALEYFDLDMNRKWSQPLSSPVPDGKILAVQSVHHKILVVSSAAEKQTKQVKLYAQYLDNKGTYDGHPLLLDSIGYEKINDDSKPDIVVSHDQSKAACLFRKISSSKEEQIYEPIVIDTNLRIIYKKDILVPVSEKHFTPLDFVLTNDADFFLLGVKYLADKRVKAPDESFYELYSYNFSKDLVSSNEIKIADKFLTDVGIAADNLNKKIVVAGFYSDNTTYSTAGIFYYSVNKDSTDSTSSGSTAFSPAFLSKFLGEHKLNSKELMNYSIDRLILRNDGGAAIIAESFYQTSSGYWDYFTQSYVSHRYYHFGNIIVLSVNPGGSILWSNSISKDQNSTDDGGYLSSYCSAIAEGKIYSIYNKYIEQESSVLITNIDGTGKQNTDVLFNELKNISVVPRSAKQIDSETLLLPAYRENKFYIAKIEF
jgi:hypothetical protein